MSAKKNKSTKREQRRIRTQQIIFGVIAAIIILSWIIGMISQY